MPDSAQKSSSRRAETIWGEKAIRQTKATRSQLRVARLRQILGNVRIHWGGVLIGVVARFGLPLVSTRMSRFLTRSISYIVAHLLENTSFLSGRQPKAVPVPPVCLLKAKTPAVVVLADSPPRTNQGNVAIGDHELSLPQPPRLSAGLVFWATVSARARPRRPFSLTKKKRRSKKKEVRKLPKSVVSGNFRSRDGRKHKDREGTL